MPTYQYRCTECATDLEAVQSFTDDPLTTCPECQGNLRKVFSAVGVVFKGSGFYATDSRTKGKANAALPGESSSAKTETAKETSPKADKPAEKKVSTTATTAA